MTTILAEHADRGLIWEGEMDNVPRTGELVTIPHSHMSEKYREQFPEDTFFMVTEVVWVLGGHNIITVDDDWDYEESEEE